MEREWTYDFPCCYPDSPTLKWIRRPTYHFICQLLAYRPKINSNRKHKFYQVTYHDYLTSVWNVWFLHSRFVLAFQPYPYLNWTSFVVVPLLIAVECPLGMWKRQRISWICQTCHDPKKIYTVISIISAIQYLKDKTFFTYRTFPSEYCWLRI